jgi:hypothetical protein
VDTLRIPPAIVERCRRDLTSLLSNIAEAEQGVVGASALSILSADGIAQVAGSLPRTVSELLRVDTMTVHKMHKYGHLIMDLLKNYWIEVDGKRDTTQVDNIYNIQRANNGTFTPSCKSSVIEHSRRSWVVLVCCRNKNSIGIEDRHRLSQRLRVQKHEPKAKVQWASSCTNNLLCRQISAEVWWQ